MKKFLIVLCILMLLMNTAFAANSPTVAIKSISSLPKLMFVRVDTVLSEWSQVEPQLEILNKEFPEHTLLEAIKVCIDKKYKNVEWTLPINITPEHEPFVAIVNGNEVTIQEVPTFNDGTIITDLSELELGIYYICFYIKGA